MNGICKKLLRLPDAKHPEMPSARAEITGVYMFAPRVDRSFSIYDKYEQVDGWILGQEGLSTSIVTEIVEDNDEHVVFRTMNSIYELTKTVK